MENQVQSQQNSNQESKWTGSVLGFFGMRLLLCLFIFLSAFTLFLTLPWIIVWFQRYITNNTYVNGKQLLFNGTGGQLFGSYIKWWLLSLVTIGIYGIFFTPVRIIQWYTKHTVFA